MIRLDHLVIIAPSLEAGVAHVREALGVDMPFGGRHPNMGTYNHLLRLGSDVFLEVIAIDPDAPGPGRPRWFGLDDRAEVEADWQAGRRLRAYVANTDDLDADLARHGGLFGTPTAQTRGALSWRFAVPDDGKLIMDGALPYMIEWSDHTNPAHLMPELGCRLASMTVTASPDARTALAALGLSSPLRVVDGGAVTIEALIETPKGVRVLR